MPPASSLLIVVLGLLACVVAFPGRLAVPLPRWRLATSAVLVAAAALILLYLPPHNALRESEVWLVGLPFVLAGIGRGAWIRLQVDHGQGKLRLARAPEEFWVVVAALLLLLVDIAGEPVGRTGSVYVKAVELALVMLAGFLVGRNAALLCAAATRRSTTSEAPLHPEEDAQRPSRRVGNNTTVAHPSRRGPLGRSSG